MSMKKKEKRKPENYIFLVSRNLMKLFSTVGILSFLTHNAQDIIPSTGKWVTYSLILE